MLLSLAELDVARDVVDVKFVSKNGEENDKLEYFLVIEEWTADNLKIFVNFTNPGAVSNGQSEDSLVMEIKNPALFVSQNGDEMTADKTTMV